MNVAIKDRWVEALRGGNYKQTSGVLHDIKEGYCCLGVLCDLYLREKTLKPGEMNEIEYHEFIWDHSEDWAGGFPSVEISTWAGISKNQMTDLADQNDQSVSFDKIADFIEEHI